VIKERKNKIVSDGSTNRVRNGRKKKVKEEARMEARKEIMSEGRVGG
jgi:hypothetical protein